jgi:hypothetical protein
MECGSLIEMADGKDTRTLCNSDKEPVYQKGASNSRAALPQFDPTAGIAVCGDATVYVIDSVLIPKEYFIDEDLELVEDQTQEVIDAPDPSDGLDYFKELLVAKGTLIQGVNTCNNMNPQFPNIDCLGEDGTVDVGPQGTFILILYYTILYCYIVYGMQCYTITYPHTRTPAYLVHSHSDYVPHTSTPNRNQIRIYIIVLYCLLTYIPLRSFLPSILNKNNINIISRCKCY